MSEDDEIYGFQDKCVPQARTLGRGGEPPGQASLPPSNGDQPPPLARLRVLPARNAAHCAQSCASIPVRRTELAPIHPPGTSAGLDFTAPRGFNGGAPGALGARPPPTAMRQLTAARMPTAARQPTGRIASRMGTAAVGDGGRPMTSVAGAGYQVRVPATRSAPVCPPGAASPRSGGPSGCGPTHTTSPCPPPPFARSRRRRDSYTIPSARAAAPSPPA